MLKLGFDYSVLKFLKSEDILPSINETNFYTLLSRGNGNTTVRFVYKIEENDNNVGCMPFLLCYSHWLAWIIIQLISLQELYELCRMHDFTPQSIRHGNDRFKTLVEEILRLI